MRWKSIHFVCNFSSAIVRNDFVVYAKITKKIALLPIFRINKRIGQFD